MDRLALKDDAIQIAAGADIRRLDRNYQRVEESPRRPFHLLGIAARTDHISLLTDLSRRSLGVGGSLGNQGHGRGCGVGRSLGPGAGRGVGVGRIVAVGEGVGVGVGVDTPP